MSMMGREELDQLGKEAKMIQSNFRTWLLRKNYINLREAARTLQQAWRDRKGGIGQTRSSDAGLLPRSSHNVIAPDVDAGVSMDLGPDGREQGHFDGLRLAPSPQAAAPADPHPALLMTAGPAHVHHDASSVALPPPPPSTGYFGSLASNRLKVAAETLQAATRRMIARRSQSMAALVIQRRWLLRYRESEEFKEKVSV